MSLQASCSQGTALAGSHRWLSCYSHPNSAPQAYILWDSTLLSSSHAPNPWPLPTILVKGIAQNFPDQELQILEIQTFIFLKNITLVLGLLHWIGNSRSCFPMWMHWPSKCKSGIKEAWKTPHRWIETEAASWNTVYTELDNSCRHLCQVSVSFVHEYELCLRHEVYHIGNIVFLTRNEKYLHTTVQAKTSIKPVQQFRLGLLWVRKITKRSCSCFFGRINKCAWSVSLVVCWHFCFCLGLRCASKNLIEMIQRWLTDLIM